MNTGINMLDKDLEALFSLDNPEKLNKIRKIASKDNPTIHDILSVINISALRIALALLSDKNYPKLLKIVNSESIPELERAKKFAEENLKALIEPNKDILREILSNADKEEFEPFHKTLNVVSIVVGKSNWIIEHNKILPAIRYVFANYQEKQVYLQSTLEWGNILYVVERLLDTLKEDIEIVPNILNDEAQKNLLVKSESLLTRTHEIKELISSIEESLAKFDKSRS